MSNGSGVASRPGHTLPVGADPNTKDGFTQWVISIHPAFEATALGKRLIAEGFDSVHDAHLVTVELLRTDFDLKSGHAAKFVEAAHAMQASGGLSWLHVDPPKVVCGLVEVRDMHGRPLVACCCDIMHAIVETHLGDPTRHPKVRLRAHLDTSDG